jgi:hypothetical protein
MFEESGKTRTSGREAVTNYKSARASSSSKRLLEVQFLRARRHDAVSSARTHADTFFVSPLHVRTRAQSVKPFKRETPGAPADDA